MSLPEPYQAKVERLERLREECRLLDAQVRREKPLPAFAREALGHIYRNGKVLFYKRSFDPPKGESYYYVQVPNGIYRLHSGHGENILYEFESRGILDTWQVNANNYSAFLSAWGIELAEKVC